VLLFYTVIECSLSLLWYFGYYSVLQVYGFSACMKYGGAIYFSTTYFTQTLGPNLLQSLTFFSDLYLVSLVDSPQWQLLAFFVFKCSSVIGVFRLQCRHPVISVNGLLWIYLICEINYTRESFVLHGVDFFLNCDSFYLRLLIYICRPYW
jgi:hypothetical protein